MRINHGARIATYSKKNGYGYVTDRMNWALTQLGYEFNDNDDTADVQLWYDQPHHIDWNFNQYRISYHPWESTKLHDDWRWVMNLANEIWTPSPLIAHWYREDGIKPPIYVYQHGVDHVWTNRVRPLDGPIKILHVGGESLRKGGDMVLSAFRDAFNGSRDVELTMKMMNRGILPNKVGQVTFIPHGLELEDLIGLYHNHHVFVYPSFGEGFGLNPLQAMATGMPTIFTGAWAPYKNLAPADWRVDSTLVDSPWPLQHPGKMFQPDYDDLVEKLRNVVNDIQFQGKVGNSLSPVVHQNYDWLELTRETFNCLENRLQK